ncbi:endoflagellar protein [Clostridiales bacterium COT073_COT-073]|nr:endoflagellar protein [Clostridiales bacterium COT073_COT-073]
MIYITKLNNVEILLNEDLIELVEETPDTIITLTTGKKVIVKESKEELYQKICEYKKEIYQR